MADKPTSEFTKLFGWLALLSFGASWIVIIMGMIGFIDLQSDEAQGLCSMSWAIAIVFWIMWGIARRSAKKKSALKSEPSPTEEVTPMPLPSALFSEDPDLLKQKQGELISIIKVIAQEKTVETKSDHLYVGVAAGTRYFLRSGDRNQHVYITGKTRHGKSTLIHTMAVQDMRNGAGVCVIDAKGDLIPDLIESIPDERLDDCILLDLKTPIPLDFMECQSQDERSILVSDIIQIFKRMDEGWGTRMEAILRYVLHTLLIYGNTTFLDIHRILSNDDFRRTVTTSEKVRSHSVLADFWSKQFDKLPKDSSTPIIVSRMADFMLSPNLQTILGTTGATLNIQKAIESQKIILVNLGGINDEAIVYGSLIVSKIQQAAFRRADMLRAERAPFMLYVDEFQKFKSSAFEAILSMAGGFNLCLTLANQYYHQLDPETRGAIINNVSSYFLFRLAPENARYFAGELTEPPVEETPKLDVRAYKDRIKFLQEREDCLDALDCPAVEYTAEYNERIHLEFELEAYQDRPDPPRPKTYIEKLPFLPVGFAIYRAANGATTLLKTPAPPDEIRTNRIDLIRQQTLREFASSAESGMNRIVDNSSCNSPSVRQDVSNDHLHTSAEKPEVEPGSAPGNIPPHQD